MLRFIKKSKSLVLMFTIILMTTILFSACSSESSSQTQTTTVATTRTTARATTTAAPTTTEEELPKDLSILLSHANVTYTKDKTNWDDDPYVSELRRLTGYDLSFEFLGHGDFVQMLTLRFASGDLPDLIRTNSIESSAHPTAIENNIIVEVGPLLEKYGQNILKGIPEIEWLNPAVSKNGKIFGIPTLRERDSNNIIFIRQDWLDSFNIDALETLDDWLYYFESVKALNADSNADPGTMKYGITIRENLIYSKVFFQQFDVHPDTWQMHEGQFVPSIIMPRMKEAINFWKMLYEKEYINPDLFTLAAGDWVQSFWTGRAGALMHDVISYDAAFYPERFPDQEGVKISMIGSPVGFNGEKGLSPLSSRHYFSFVIPTKSKSPESAVALLDIVWSSEEIETFYNFGIEGRNYDVVNGDIVWDKTKIGFEELEYMVYQLSLNLKGVYTASDTVVSKLERGDALIEGFKTSKESSFENLAMYMPAIDVFQTSPELDIGARAGTLFLDMFAKVITGREDLDKAFDAFVVEWKRRGGDDAIKQATEWYNSFYN